MGRRSIRELRAACEMRSGEPIANDGEHEVLWDGNWLQPPKVLYAISQGKLSRLSVCSFPLPHPVHMRLKSVYSAGHISLQEVACIPPSVAANSSRGCARACFSQILRDKNAFQSISCLSHNDEL